MDFENSQEYLIKQLEKRNKKLEEENLVLRSKYFEIKKELENILEDKIKQDVKKNSKSLKCEKSISENKIIVLLQRPKFFTILNQNTHRTQSCLAKSPCLPTIKEDSNEREFREPLKDIQINRPECLKYSNKLMGSKTEKTRLYKSVLPKKRRSFSIPQVRPKLSAINESDEKENYF